MSPPPTTTLEDVQAKELHKESFSENATNPQQQHLRDLPFYRTTFFQLKVFICITLTFAVFLLKEAILPNSQPNCVEDKIMNLLAPVNKLIINNLDTWGRFFKITAQIPLDFIFFGQMALWMYKGKSSRLFISLLVFFGIRALTMQVFLFERPEGFNWSDPGFPSMIVPYGEHNDFFFSGHVGFLVIMAAEFSKLGYKKISVFILILIIYEAFVLISHRVHFTIDITAGAIFGHYCYLVVGYYSASIDKFFVALWEKIAGVNPEEKPLLEKGQLDVNK